MSLEVSHSGFDFAGDSLDVSDALNSTFDSSEDSIEEALCELFSTISGETNWVANGSLLHSITDVLTHGVVVRAVIGGNCTSDVIVDIDTVNEDILSDLEGDVPGRSVAVEVLEFLSELLSLSAGARAVLDVLAESLSDGSDFLDSRDVFVSLEVSHSGLNLAGDSLDVPDAGNSTFNSSKDSIEETLSELFSSISGKASGFTKSGLPHSIANVMSHSDVVSSIVGSDGASDVAVDIDSIDKNVLANLEGNVPGRGIFVDILKLVDKLLSLWANSLAVLDVF